ncbi:MAG TPA: thioredoxin domain-containing protein [Pyrinomonadaceae bacterium]|nr:thioredoxin domain-containing protein [Pyrinomonadaceae bacterium]
MEEHEFTNHLINETSPYLLQHAHNPVEWYPWGVAAFEKAKAENKPVLLSIGYSACHWCHVMAHESFEDEAIAELMNQYFVNIKVDREERPDLDQIYMNAVQMMTHHGGWPMTVFLTPDGVPFYGGTYFPPQDRYNMPGFPRILISVAEAYRDRPEDVSATSTSILKELERVSVATGSEQPISEETLSAAYVGLIRAYDSTNGGFGGPPKFPPSMALEFLLRTHARTRQDEPLNIIRHTLTKMANGGIYDHLGGGFHRYSVDARWLVPHFEKMLYDNALLSRLYLHYYQLTGDLQARGTAEGILDYVLREMTDVNGGFYSTQDADSEGHEGKFFVWTVDEINHAIGEDALLFNAFYNVTEEGNFEGKNILNVTEPLEAVAAEMGLDVDEARASIDRSRKKLFALREQRVKPGRDEKTLTAWNGLMMASFAEGGVILQRNDYLEAARQNADFVLTNLQSDGLLLRTYKDGKAKLNGYLEDYAFMIEGLITLSETSGELRWLLEGLRLADKMIEEFWDAEQGGFFFTGESHESLIVRQKDYFDNATPSGNSVAGFALLRLATLTDNQDYRNRAVAVLHEVADSARRYPSGFGYALCAVDFYLSTPTEIAILGDDAAVRSQFLAEVWRQYLPNKVIATATGADHPDSTPVALLHQKPVPSSATAYVCEHYTCQAPASTVAELRQQLTNL